MKCSPFVAAASLIGDYAVSQVKVKENVYSAYIGISSIRKVMTIRYMTRNLMCSKRDDKCH